MDRKKDSAKVWGATVIALTLLFAVTFFGHQNNVPHSDSAVILAQTDLQTENLLLKHEAIRLGDDSSQKTLEEQWDVVRLQMRNAGASEETIPEVEATASNPDFATIGRVSASQIRFWPVLAKRAFVGNQRVWIVYQAHWNTDPPPTGGRCGNGLDDPFYDLRYRVHVINDEAPYHCWLSPDTFRILTPEERKNFVRDSEYIGYKESHE